MFDILKKKILPSEEPEEQESRRDLNDLDQLDIFFENVSNIKQFRKIVKVIFTSSSSITGKAARAIVGDLLNSKRCNETTLLIVVSKSSCSNNITI